MTDYQAVPCYQCEGHGIITIPDHSTGHYINKYSVFFRAWVYYDKTVECGICNGRGYVAVDVEKLVKLN